jgi:nitrite reductase/ring-hydroxylating ferredoxin subunit
MAALRRTLGAVSEEQWQPVIAFEELEDARPERVTVDGIDAIVVRNGEAPYAIGLRCPHQGAALDRGVLRFTGSLPTVTCPAHGSMFDLTDGKVRRGPAMHPVPAFDVRVVDGVVEVRPRT